MLARAAGRVSRDRNTHVFGASRARVIRQLFTENFLLAALGAGAGLLLSWWSLKAVVRLRSSLPYLLSFCRTQSSPFTLTNPNCACLDLTRCSFRRWAPVSRSVWRPPCSRRAPTWPPRSKTGGLAAGRRGAILGRSRLRNGLVVAQVALCLMMLIATGLLLRGLNRARHLGI